MGAKSRISSMITESVVLVRKIQNFILGKGQRGHLLALLILGLFAYIALVWAFRKTCRRSLRKQLVEDGIPICINCGYDLRASKDRCPECGEGVR